MGCTSSAAASADLKAVGMETPGSGTTAGADAGMISGVSLSSQVELSISATGLAQLDTLSSSDPMAVLYESTSTGGLRELGRTEVISNNNSPSFVKIIRVQYKFEEQQKLVCRLYDVDSTMHSQAERVNVESQDFIGEIQCQLAQIMGSRGCSYRAAVANKTHTSRAQGHITIRGEEVRNANAKVTFQLVGEKLENKDSFGKSDPFVRIARLNEDGSSIPVFKTEVVMNNLNPAWRPVSLSLQRLSNGDPFRPLLIEVLDWDKDGSHELIGRAQTSVDDLLKRGASGDRLALINPSLKAAKGAAYVNSGLLRVASSSIVAQPSFLDYIGGGCELSFMAAIDFTGSNGSPTSPTSLHYRDPRGYPNQYQTAIGSVGGVLEYYDADKVFPVFGFGGSPAPGKPVSHCFPMYDGSGRTDGCVGISGVMTAYNNTLGSVQLSGPTLFTEVLQRSAAIAASSNVTQFNQKYFVLLIITDGIINDLETTVANLVGAADLPLSVLIIGVGNADFSQMNALDGDSRRLSSGGRVASRDIVQFVPMRDFLSRGPGVDVAAEVSKALLAEIPGQVLEYFGQRGLTPNPRPAPPTYGVAAPVAAPEAPPSSGFV